MLHMNLIFKYPLYLYYAYFIFDLATIKKLLPGDLIPDYLNTNTITDYINLDHGKRKIALSVIFDQQVFMVLNSKLITAQGLK